jgi:hypothetical protein
MAANDWDKNHLETTSMRSCAFADPVASAIRS